MRSIARWVLPVFVGPSTAVTPRERACEGRERRSIAEGLILPLRVVASAAARLERGTSFERNGAESMTGRDRRDAPYGKSGCRMPHAGCAGSGPFVHAPIL